MTTTTTTRRRREISRARLAKNGEQEVAENFLRRFTGTRFSLWTTWNVVIALVTSLPGRKSAPPVLTPRKGNSRYLKPPRVFVIKSGIAGVAGSQPLGSSSCCLFASTGIRVTYTLLKNRLDARKRIYFLAGGRQGSGLFVFFKSTGNDVGRDTLYLVCLLFPSSLTFLSNQPNVSWRDVYVSYPVQIFTCSRRFHVPRFFYRSPLHTEEDESVRSCLSDQFRRSRATRNIHCLE